MAFSTYDHILIVGGGEFGLSTALALLQRPRFGHSRITILESAPVVPNPSGSSVDASRIIRTDYAHISYATLASQAQVFWRDLSDSGWGGEGRYSETGFVLTADEGREIYVNEALANVQNLATAGLPIDINKISRLDNKNEIKNATRYEGVSGDKGYANWNSGWAHAEKVVSYAIRRLAAEGRGRVVLRTGAKVKNLLLEDATCRGVCLEGGEKITAGLTILAAGAWSMSLLNLEERCLATGQPLAYIKLSKTEQAQFNDRPVIMNLSNGMFIIPPVDCELKIARHTFGYLSPQKVQFHDGCEREVSVPKTGISIPAQAQEDFRTALKELIPALANRPFLKTRVCWYADTPDGNFLIDYHPDHAGLLVATGGSGHAFKFFPIIGEKIVDRLEHRLEQEFADLWCWKSRVADFRGCEDGSRSGEKGIYI